MAGSYLKRFGQRPCNQAALAAHDPPKCERFGDKVHAPFKIWSAAGRKTASHFFWPRSILLPSSPPEGFFGFVRDVAPGQADIVQVALGPVAEFLASLITLPPGVKGLAQLAQNALNMIICHRFVVQSGHVQLRKLSLIANICASRAIGKRHFVPLRMK
jgi:hypothetical protein